MPKQFSSLGFELHLVDQRNHGRSFHDSEFNYEALASDLLHYCEYYGLKNCILLGHSMGGKTAMLFASLYPELVSKLIIADIAPRFYPVHHEAILEGLASLRFSNNNDKKRGGFTTFALRSGSGDPTIFIKKHLLGISRSFRPTN